MSHVKISFFTGSTLNTNTIATYRILESILKNHPKCKFYQASSSEMFGSSPPLKMKILNLILKVLMNFKSYCLLYNKIFRQAHGLFAANGILFNHESPRRGINFVTRKIAIDIKNFSWFRKKVVR